MGKWNYGCCFFEKRSLNNFSIIIPLYNEADNINPLYLEIIESIPKNFNYEIIFINDHSTDDTNIILDKLSKKKFVNILNNKMNMGQSFSIMSGIKAANYDTIVTIDGDGQNVPKDIVRLLKVYDSSKDIFLVGGVRVLRKDSFIKVLSSKIANKVRSLLLSDNCPDTGCGLKVFSKRVFIKFPFFDGIHRFLPALFKGFGYKTVFIDVSHRARLRGFSKYGIFKRLFKGIFDIIRVMKILKSS